jgi:branched-chain amino acid transport system substrate-binding protein
LAGSVNRRKSALVLAVVVAVAAACGARVPPHQLVGQAAAGGAGPAAGAAGSSAQPVTATTPGSGGGGLPQAGTAQLGTKGSGPGQATRGAFQAPSPTAAQAAALTQSNFDLNPAAEASYCRYSSSNGSSAPGVTPTSITLGNVSGLTGILSNNFNQGPEAVQALFDAVNAYGGICGRKLILDVEDDGQNASHNAADVADLIAKPVFAFAGSTSDADNGGVQEMVQAGIPDIGQAINPNRGSSPVYYTAGTYGGITKNGSDYINDTLAEGMKAYNDFPTKMAILAYSVQISALAARQFAQVFTDNGAQICYENTSVPPAGAPWSSIVIQMEAAGCNGVFTTIDVTGNGQLLQAMHNQGFHPLYAGTTLDGYSPAQIQVAGEQAAQGFQAYLNFAPFTDPNPAVRLYLSELQTYEPGKQPSSFGIEAWACAQMLIYALIKSGANPTRASVVSVFDNLDNWNTGGAMAPVTPRTRAPGLCIVEVAVSGNDFVRKWPGSGFFCQGHLVAVPAS